MTENTRKWTIYTIGHSIHPLDDFVSLLKRHRMDAVAAKVRDLHAKIGELTVERDFFRRGLGR